MTQKEFLDKVIDRTIFKEDVKIELPDTDDCFVCGGKGHLKVENTSNFVKCNTCKGSGKTYTGKKKKVDGKVLYVPVAFEENKERVIYVSVVYYENDKPVNLSVNYEVISIENKSENEE